MTNEQINTAIAEACGWSNDDIERGYTLCQFPESVPDYCNDLNAMHEAEKVFTYEEAQKFEDELCDVCVCDMENRHKEYPRPFRFAVAHATARQRAEAFLKAIGKWEGGPQ